MTTRRAGAIAAVCAAVVLAVPVPAAHAAAGVPYTDPAAKGSIGFCDQNGHAVTSGSVSKQPFVWRAVSSAPAPAGYADSKAKATLMAYQPRPAHDPAEWTGEALTGAATFTNPAHPMAQATAADSPLLWFVQAYPPKWHGTVQLRMYFSSPGKQQYTLSYPTADIKVSGDTWTLLRGGSTACAAGSATAAETKLLTDKQLAKGVIDSSATATPSAGSRTTSPTGSAAASSAGASAATASGASGSSSGSSSTPLVVGLGVLLALVVAGVATWWWRRRGAAAS